MTLDQLDATLNNPKRLAALGIVATSTDVEFVFLRDSLRQNDSGLSKHVAALASAEYSTARKTGKRPSRPTWNCATRDGRSALAVVYQSKNRSRRHSSPSHRSSAGFGVGAPAVSVAFGQVEVLVPVVHPFAQRRLVDRCVDCWRFGC